MIENEDIPTTPRPIPQADADEATTIRIAATTAHASTAVATSPAHPYVSIDDLLTIQIASDPQLSPDGTQIAFTVLRCNDGPDTTSSAIWLVQTGDGTAEPPRQVTHGNWAQHDFAPRWSPDGQTLAFLSDRSGIMQVYLLSMHGGEARQLSNLPQDVSEYSWRPDGSALLAHSPWKPDDERHVIDTSATSMVYKRLDDQWDSMGYRRGRRQQLWLIPLAGDASRLTSEPVDLVQSCWSPDGSEVAFCANRRNDPDLSASMALWVLTLATGQMRRLTPETGWAQMPVWSPDGQSIAYLYTEDQTEASNVTPWIVSAHGSDTPHLAVPDAQELTCQAWVIDELRNEWIQRPQWYPDGKSLLVAAQKRGQVHLYRIDMGHNTVVQLTSGNGRYVSPQLSKNGQSIAMVRADWFTPGDIWSMHSDGSHQHKLTGVNDAFLRNHQLIRPKRITWQSFDGLAIEGWLYLPPLAEGTKVPLILEVHGGPTLAWGDGYIHEFQVLAGRGYAVLAPNPRGSAGYGEEFCKKVLNDWGGDDFRDLMAGIDHAIATEPIDATRLGVGGISYGGYMTNWAISQTNRFKAAVSRNGISNLASMSLLTDQTLWFDMAMDGGGQDRETLYRERSALSFVDRIETPLLLLHAANDLRCPFSESLQLFTALRKRKRTVELVCYPGVSHLMDWPDVGTPDQRVDRLRRTVEWFERFV